MAFGFSPKHLHSFSLENVDYEHFLVVAIEAVRKLNWNVSFMSETGFIAYSNFSWSSWGEEITVKIDNGIVSIKSECTGSQFWDWGKNKTNVDAVLSKIEELKSEFSEEIIEQKIIELRNNYATGENDLLNKPPSTAKDKITGVFSLFKPIEGYFITPILININILIFIVMLISGVHIMAPEHQDLLDWGANFKPLTLEGQWWRLFTACFLHIGILHLLLNMYALVYIGLLLEPYLGRSRFLAAYLISGIAASMTSLWWHDLTISAGASGAIFGIYGVFLALLTTNLLDKAVKKALMTSVAIFVSYNILNGFKPNSGIDNAAHIGGLLSGLFIGYSFVPSLKQFGDSILKYSTIFVLAIVLFISSFTVYSTLPNDIGKYEKRMQQFVAFESMALEVYNLPGDTPNEEILAELKNRGVYYWNENLKLIESFNELDLPLAVRARNSRLKEYCELRIKCYEVIYKAIEEDTDRYQKEIDNYNNQIDAIVTELTAEL